MGKLILVTIFAALGLMVYKENSFEKDRVAFHQPLLDAGQSSSGNIDKPADENEERGNRVFPADIREGVIGTTSQQPIDDPSDNIFHIQIPGVPDNSTVAYLQYELFGAKNHLSIARSINNAQAVGGQFVSLSPAWSLQKEMIASSQLKKGDNIVRFSLPVEAPYYYQVRNVAIHFEKQPATNENFFAAINGLLGSDAAYIKGVINENMVYDDKSVELFCNNQPIEIYNGNFETVLPFDSANSLPFTVHLKLIKGGKTISSKKVTLTKERPPDYVYNFAAKGVTSAAIYSVGKGLVISSDNLSTKIRIPVQAARDNQQISVTSLRDIDIPALNPDLVNVTKGAAAYRFLPHGTIFKKEAELTIAYDSTLIPEGFTPADIRTYYFDETTKQWIDLPLDTVITDNKMVVSKTTHFTDMINGIIKVPESPQTQGYTPTFIKDIKAGNPSLGIDLINPPSANAMGNAALSYSLKIPNGRQGMQPSIDMLYNNEGGNGWLGLGWNLSVSSIGIDTRWGVPRYDGTKETETYTLNGEQLAPIVHKGALVTRTANKQFHPRVEGSFHKIIRHGSNPANYWWDVINKEGTHSYYGGTPLTGVINQAVLKDENGNIAYWALTDTRDLNDNFVHYIYKEVADPGVAGGTNGKQLYISEIFYTGHGQTQGVYSIEFISDRQLGESKRKDIDINGRLGFKMVTADLLRRVNVKYNTEIIRSYTLDYREGAFYKTLLKSINQLDNAGNVFYSHQLTYNDDVNSSSGYTPLGGNENWSPAFDDIQGDIINPISGFTGEATALNSVKSSGTNFGLYIGMGLWDGSASKSSTVGITFGAASGSSEGLATLVDINGDGLPDKVFKKSGQLFYRANKGVAAQQFGPMRPISGVNSFSHSKSSTSSRGLESNWFYFVAKEDSRTTNTTDLYFSDFNGDGLIDIANNGVVFFNRLNADGDPEFLPTSTGTPSLVEKGASVNADFLKPDTALQAKQEREYPLQDIVRFWQAPDTGLVNIYAPVQLLNITSPGVVNPKLDGVRVSIQRKGTVLWNTPIAAGDYSQKNPVILNQPVLKGDRIYFRVESVYNGEDDLVSWDPVIQYTTVVTPAKDVNHRSTSIYQASQDFILNNEQFLPLNKSGTISIDGVFRKQTTSDTVRLMIIKKTPTVHDTTLYIYPCGAIVDQPILKTMQVTAGDSIRFVLQADSYMDRAALEWFPHYQYTFLADNTPVININGQPTYEGFAVPDHTNYNDWVIKTPLYTNTVQDTVIVRPRLIAAAGTNGRITFTVKGADTVYAKRKIRIVNGVMQPVDSIYRIRSANDTLYCEYHTSNRALALALQTVQFIEEKDSVYIDQSTNQVVHTIRRMNHNAGLFTDPKENFLGSLFRGWGHFSYRGSVPFAPLDESKINLDGYSGYSNDPNLYTDPGMLDQIIDASMAEFIPLYAKGQQQSWTGYDSSVYVTKNTQGSARLWMHNVAVDPIMQGDDLAAVNKVNYSETSGFTLSVIIGNGTSSETSTTNKLDVMDLNGDRHPDILHLNQVQYSLPNGGLESGARQHDADVARFYGSSEGFSTSGSIGTGAAKTVTSYNSMNIGENAGTGIGFPTPSGGANRNEDKVESNWIDINGDGLPDKLFEDGTVRLNLGYKFGPAENWGVAGFEKGKSTQYSAGLGFSIGDGSFTGGFNLMSSNGEGQTSLEDINGDGLPDKLSVSGSTVTVQLNNGHGFGSSISWNGLYTNRKNSSTGESINGAFTISIPIPIIIAILKLSINPSFGSNDGISRENDLIMDIDGDGLQDIVHSGDDGNLTAIRSTIERTNMLQEVKRPMGSSFKIYYERMGNTYDMPQSKWVLKSVEVTDGFPGDGADVMKNSFTYSGGIYNRDEREFYGFKTVVTNQLNTSSGNTVYRRNVQQYLNESYYVKGLPEKEWVQNAGGSKYTETEYQYDLRSVAGGSLFPAMVQKKQSYYEGNAVADVSTFTRFDYDLLGNTTKITDAGDGSQQDIIIADITYHNNDPLYIKSIPANIEVNTAAGVTRKRATSIDNTGSITQIRQYLANGAAAMYDMEYDGFGNLSKITRPENHRGQRMWYGYTYDNTLHSYVTNVEDAYGYSSSSTYDYRFGELTGTISENDERIRYELDNIGRLVRITGPYELAAGKPYTIAFDYHPGATVPYALTRHYDPEYDADINTITFMDGLGRVLQVKKQAAIFKGKNIPDDVIMTVSGRVYYDAFGRTMETRYPVKEAIGPGNITLNTNPGSLQLRSTYDVLDRPLQTTFADGAVENTAYTISSGFFKTTTADALQNKKETLTDVKNRKRILNVLGGPNGTITTQFFYNAMSELLRVTDANNNAIVSSYDNLGRKLSVTHPDAGLTEYVYDLAGNLLKKITAQIRKEIPTAGAIQYQYDFERLTDIDYPRQYQNKVKYIYGKPGSGNRTGRLILQEDASGGQEFFYGKLGENTKTIRTIVVGNTFFTTYVSEQEYDTWNRMKKMTYPDGEVIQYHYNKGGGLSSIDGTRDGHTYKYINQLGYDEYEQRVYLQNGNGTESKYAYEPLRRRLSTLQSATPSARLIMDNSYSYDAVGNILGITNNAPRVPGKLGGFARHQYQYDNLYRLTGAFGEFKGGSDSAFYGLSMSYDNLYNITRKQLGRSQAQSGYNLVYKYGGASPHQPDSIGNLKYNYDLNGNLLRYSSRQNFWDEENRLMAVINNGIISKYSYDAGSERVIKSSGGLQGTWINGAPAGMVNHDSNYVAYVSPYLVCRRTSFTKHIYIETQRIATKIGIGRFSNISFPQRGLTAGGVDYLKRMTDIQKQRIEYYASLGVSPGPPSDKYFYALPYNNGIASPVIVDTSANSVPSGWPGNTTPPTNGPPIFVNPIPSNDSVRAGYGFVSTGHFYEQNQYFYHPDHLGSTSYVTNLLGEVSQHQEYTPFGETFFEEHANSYTSPYLFNAKERDPETGLYYYGARYYDPRTSVWLSVDPMSEKYPGLSPYNYCENNPVILVDPDGKSSVVTSVLGFLRAAGGAVQVVGGAALLMTPEPTGLTKVGGVIAVSHGLDDVQAGLRQAFTGESVESLTFQGTASAVKGLGGSDELAAGIATGVDIAAAIPGAAAGASKVSNLLKGSGVAKPIISLEDARSLRGAKWSEAEEAIPKDWIKSSAKKGEGVRYSNPNKPGEQIMLQKGKPGSSDPLHSGPYMKISKDGKVTRIPLQGNPALND